MNLQLDEYFSIAPLSMRFENGRVFYGFFLISTCVGGLPCELEGILESPVVHGYRNKCEFSVGYSQQGKPTVGFMLGNFR